MKRSHSFWNPFVLVVAYFAVGAHSFSITDSFHLVQSAAATAAHQSHAADLLKSYTEQLTAHPLPTKMLTGATLAMCGDAIAQSQQTDTEYDRNRAASFGIFDMAYRALQHVTFPILVSECHGQYLGRAAAALGLSGSVSSAAHMAAAMEQTLGSQLLIVPFLYYPAFFALTGAMQGLSASEAVQRGKETFLPLMKRNLLFWIPVQYMQFAFIPTDLQIPFLSCAGLAWTFILSVYAGSAKQYAKPEDPAKELLAIAETSMSAVTTVEVTGIPHEEVMLRRETIDGKDFAKV